MVRCFILGMVQAPCFCLAIPVIGLRFGNSHAEQYINKKKTEHPIYKSDIQQFNFFVGVPGFEPGTSCSQSRRANRTALHPEKRCFLYGKAMQRYDFFLYWQVFWDIFLKKNCFFVYSLFFWVITRVNVNNNY